MLLERFVNGRARSNAYVYSAAPGRCVVVDPGVGAARKVTELLGARGLVLEAVLLTHGHPDHLWTAAELAHRHDAPVHLHALDWRWLTDPAAGGYLPLVGLAGRLISRAKRLRPRVLRPVEGHQVLEAAGAEFLPLHTPGHTTGSVCYVSGSMCFVGDTVFRGGLGHTRYPGGERRALRRSVRSQLWSLPDDMRLLPGHGPETTVARERDRWKVFAGACSQ